MIKRLRRPYKIILTIVSGSILLYDMYIIGFKMGCFTWLGLITFIIVLAIFIKSIEK